jgi:hypothetical protein
MVRKVRLEGYLVHRCGGHRQGRGAEGLNGAELSRTSSRISVVHSSDSPCRINRSDFVSLCHPQRASAARQLTKAATFQLTSDAAPGSPLTRPRSGSIYRLGDNQGRTALRTHASFSICCSKRPDLRYRDIILTTANLLARAFRYHAKTSPVAGSTIAY